MTNFIAPWNPNFTNDINNAIVTAENDVNTAVDAINTVVPGVLPTIPTITPVIPTITPPLPAPIPTTAVPPVPQTPSAPPATPSIEQAIRDAWPQLSEQLKKDAIAYAEAYGIGALTTGNLTPHVPDITYEGQSLTHTAAKGHALRTFVIGMATSAAAAVLTAVGSQAHLDFFSRDGWVATGSIAAATLINTLVSYLTRLQITPGFEQQLASAPPALAVPKLTQKK